MTTKDATDDPNGPVTEAFEKVMAMGHKAMEAGEYALAYGSFGQASRIDAESTEAHFRAGLASERLGNPVVAAYYYTLALATPGATHKVWFFLARAKRLAGETEAAAYAYRRYLRRKRDVDPSLLAELGGKVSVVTAIAYDAFVKPAYAYGIYHAVQLANALDVSRVSVLELGVASGRGLLVLERYADMFQKISGVKIDVVGFDSGDGLPAPQDRRDISHYFSQGDYAMDQEALTERLTTARLVLGDARETVRDFLGSGHSPIGAIFFDMDLYSSTAGVLKVLGDETPNEFFLPRVSCYFDDAVPKRASEVLKDYSSQHGEALAIAEFNEQNTSTYCDPDLLKAAFPQRRPWHECLYLLHRTGHDDYETPVREAVPSALRLNP